MKNNLTRPEVDTDFRYGKPPEERTIDELMNLGVINLDKPSGPTSHQVVSWVKKMLNVKKTGHGGTLDPKVTGVLPTALNKGVKGLQTLLVGKKEYVCVMQIHRKIKEDKIREAFSEFRGQIYQLPPVRAAVKRELRKRWIYYLDILEIDNRYVLFKVGCQAGTYIRTLVRDIGEVLGIGAHMQELRRTKSCSFSEEKSFSLVELKDAYEFWKEDGDERIKEIILPMERMFKHIPKIVIKDSTVDAICHGANLAVPGVLNVDSNIERGNLTAIFSLKGEGVALAEATMNAEQMVNKKEGIAARTKSVLMEINTYPMLWSKKS